MGEADKYPSQMADRFQVRFPDGMRDQIKALADQNGRSMNTEILMAIEAWLARPAAPPPGEPTSEEILDAIKRIIAREKSERLR